MGECVEDGELRAFDAFFVRGRRDDFVDEVLCGFAQDSGGVAGRVEVDGSAFRWGGFAGDSGGGEGGGVGDGDVAVNTVEEGGVVFRLCGRGPGGWGGFFRARRVWSQLPPVNQ